MKKRNPSSIRSDVVGVNLTAIFLTVLLALGGTLLLTIYSERSYMDRNLMNSAQVIAHVPAVAQVLESGVPSETLNTFLDDTIRQVSDIDIIVVADTDSIQLYYPDRDYVGTRYAGKDQQRVLDGEGAYTSNDTGLSGIDRCAYAEVRGEDGELLGFVVVGIYLRSLSGALWRTVISFLAIGIAAAGVGVLLSFQLSNRIKHALMGYEPDTLRLLFHQREDILEALEEGVLAIDGTCSVMYINRAAGEMLPIQPKKAMGRPLHEIYPRSTLDRILRTGKPEYNVSMKSLENVRVLSDRIPIRENGAVVGAVAIFRNRTELTRLAEDLTGVRHMVDAMRAYTHEFMNKLHVVLGLLQIGEQERAERYIMDTTRIQQEAVSRIVARIEEPSVAALLVGKTSRASELGIRLRLDPGSTLGKESAWLPGEAYVTILGNLIENAIEVLNQSNRTPKEIEVSIRESAEGLFLCVEDTGPGLPQEMEKGLFRQGSSTKGTGRGTGLFLVKDIVDTYQGTIRVESEAGVGTAFFISFRKTK